jgi:hypothetical protein
MAVTNNATLIEDHEVAPTYTSVGGGQGAGVETNFYFLGVQSSSRKMSGVTKNGFWFNPGATTDLSATGTHFKVFINAITQAGFTDFWLRIGDSTTTYEEHAVGISFYDTQAGGWIPVWVEVGAGTDTGTPDFTIADEFCVLCTMGTISGNVKNWCTDQAHSSTRPVLLWDGTTGDLDDFITTESTAGTGTLKLLNGLYTCFSNFKIGSATATTFDMDGKTVAFPDATWLPTASTWMGIDYDLQNASTVITAVGGSVISGNPTGATARKPDVIVTGTSGTLDFTGRSFDGMRIITFTSGVTADDAIIQNSGVVTVAGASMAGAIVNASTVAADASAIIWNFASDPNGELDNMTITKGTNAHHAIEYGGNTPATTTLTGIDFVGFNATTDSNDSALYFPDTGSDVAWTVNLVGCSGNISYKKVRAGDTVTLVVDPVTVQVTVLNLDTGLPIENARVFVPVTSGVNFPYQDSVTITGTGTTATVTHTAHGLATNDNVVIRGANEDVYNGTYQITVTGVNTYTYTTNETIGSSPATGTIISTFVIISGLTNASGIISDTRTYGVDQPIGGWARKSTASPFYRQGAIVDTVSSTAGKSLTISLSSDE